MNNINANCPQAAHWREFLESSTTPRETELAHLADCHACQQALEFSAADYATWHLIEETLREESDSRGSAAKDCAAQRSNSSGYRSRSSMPESEWSDSALRELLPPPRQPDFLSRLGRYDIERLIGYGGMGLVFRAHDSQLNRVVAVKILAPHLSRLGAARQRFAREARAVAAVVHPRIVAIHDVVPESDPPFLVMQLVDGPSLQQVVDATGPLPVEQIVRLAIQLSEALAAAHEQGLIHRDIKPGNILLEADGQRALLTDFGLVRTLDDASLTHSAVLAGTPHYMSPEQARGEPIDRRSDLFALGSVLYHLCTGRPPFRASGPLAVLHRVCHERHRPIREIRRDVPARLATIINRLLNKQPSQRFPSADSLRTELIQLQRGDKEPILSRSSNALRRDFLVKRLTVLAAVIALIISGSIYFRSMISLASKASPPQPAVVMRADSAGQEVDSQSAQLPNGASIMSAATHGAFADLDVLEQRIDTVRNRLNSLEGDGVTDAQRTGSTDVDRWQYESERLKNAIQDFETVPPF